MNRGSGGHLVVEAPGSRISFPLPERVARAFRGSAARIAEASLL